MLILHGVYDHGKVEITDKELPDMKAEVEINFKQNKVLTIGELSGYRGIIKKSGLDAVKFQRKIRNEW